MDKGQRFRSATRAPLPYRRSNHLSKVVRCESEAPPQVVGINMVREPGQGVAVGYFEKPSTLQESP